MSYAVYTASYWRDNYTFYVFDSAVPLYKTAILSFGLAL